ncbi:MAG: DUF58 domain-containing protein [Bacteroidota bacterium]|nr:DUF58 domain-containing protein [Bacteroidota bacterium]
MIPVLFTIALFILALLILVVIADVIFLYGKPGIKAKRILAGRFSNGDENPVQVLLKNNYPFTITSEVVDEIPYQFQLRNWKRKLKLNRDEDSLIHYTLKPLERGELHFENIKVFVQSPLKMVVRKYSFNQPAIVKVYPSYMQMRRFQLLATADRLQEMGVKKIRRLGHSMEFEQIKEYVRGDDYRTLNWLATARKGSLMVNHYTDERSQQVYCLINKGRVMKMPFEDMTLLDYAINAALVITNVALSRQDKAGIICFSQHVDLFLPADKKPGQLNLVLEGLYKQETNFLEPDYEQLFSLVRNRITQRSFFILFTNFESIEGLNRELPFLKRLAHYHLVMVVFFINTELKKLMHTEAETTEDIYIKTIAEKYDHEKKLMVKELQQNGILAVLTTPADLTINSINKYLEIKNRQVI